MALAIALVTLFGAALGVGAAWLSWLNARLKRVKPRGGFIDAIEVTSTFVSFYAVHPDPRIRPTRLTATRGLSPDYSAAVFWCYTDWRDRQSALLAASTTKSRLIGLAARVLPAAIRQRHVDEWLAELGEMTTRRTRIAFVVRVSVRVGFVRSARRGVNPAPRRD
jgi:hypothetical protein